MVVLLRGTVRRTDGPPSLLERVSCTESPGVELGRGAPLHVECPTAWEESNQELLFGDRWLDPKGVSTVGRLVSPPVYHGSIGRKRLIIARRT